MVQSDPWTAIVNDTNCVNINGIASTNETELPQTFEDNFQPTSSDSVLPDSTEYLQSLERKLQKLRKDTNVTEQLKAHREHCVENLLRGNLTLNTSVNEDLNRLEEEFEESRRRNITRYLNPEQALNSSELVHIINHDQLDSNSEKVEESIEDCTDQQ